MDASRYVWPVILALVLVAACSSTGTTNRKRPSEQAPLSGVDPNYRQPGVFTGETGTFTVYSSEEAKARAEEKAGQEEMLPSTIEPGSDEAREYEQWKADQEYAEFREWKKAQAEQQGQAGESAAEAD